MSQPSEPQDQRCRHNRTRMKVDPFVRAWCLLRLRDGKRFTTDELEVYVRACANEHGIRCAFGTASRSFRELKGDEVAIIEADKLGENGEGWRILAVRELEYVKPLPEAEQLNLLEAV